MFPALSHMPLTSVILATSLHPKSTRHHLHIYRTVSLDFWSPLQPLPPGVTASTSHCSRCTCSLGFQPALSAHTAHEHEPSPGLALPSPGRVCLDPTPHIHHFMCATAPSFFSLPTQLPPHLRPTRAPSPMRKASCHMHALSLLQPQPFHLMALNHHFPAQHASAVNCH